MKTFRLLTLVIILFFLFGCGASDKNNGNIFPETAALESSLNQYDDMISEEEPFYDEEKNAENTGKINTSIDRKIIKNATISFQTSSINDTKNLLVAKTKAFGGYIANDNITDYGYQQQYLEVRIPANKFESFLSSIKASAKKIDHQEINTNDVTEEYIDIEARVKTKKALKDRYVELLNKAQSVKDILEIEREISQLQEDIESIEGRLNYLKNQVAFSTFYLTFYETQSSAFDFGDKIKDGLKNGWKNLLWFFVGLAHIWPFILILLIGVYLLVRLIKKSSRKNKQ
ncbi:MAG: DUF4349 domain-containing protein [Vicingaceae bacterium]